MTVDNALERVRVERLADLAEEPGDEPGAECHEDRDPVRGRRQKDRAEQRERGDDHHAACKRERGEDDAVGPPAADPVGDQQAAGVDEAHVERRTPRPQRGAARGGTWPGRPGGRRVAGEGLARRRPARRRASGRSRGRRRGRACRTSRGRRASRPRAWSRRDRPGRRRRSSPRRGRPGACPAP